ncbi:hypothetical protein ACSNOK_01805 [Streptomyces sp. URMC 126]|uniref:hypothetical protein n=1 Tax=Streptomyces sp. URMC 126 TaxID=3423401 RepID=UPI003F1B25C5
MPTPELPRVTPPARPAAPRPELVTRAAVISPPAAAPVPRERHFGPDLTGLWEADGSGRNTTSPLLVQISQAGAALAIWFSRPPRGLTGVDVLVLKDGDGRERKADETWVHGVARGFLADKTGRNRLRSGEPVPLTWCVAQGANDAPYNPFDATATDPFNPLDPWQSEGASVTGLGFRGKGTLHYPWDAPERLVLAFARNGGPVLRLRRVSPVVRWPRRLIGRLAEPLRTQVLIDQTRPVPAAYQSGMTSLFGSPSSEFAARIRAWKHTDGAQRRNNRVAIAGRLECALAEPWRSRLRDVMAMYGNFRNLEVDGTLQTYYAWLNEILDDEVRDGGVDAAYPPGWDTVRVQEALRSLGVGGEASFLYRFTFHDVGVAGPVAGVRLGVFGALAKVEKFRLVFKRSPDGKRVYDAFGRPETEEPTPVKWDDGHQVFAVFGRMDAGLSTDIVWRKGFGRPKDVVMEPGDKLESSVADLGTLDFRSELDLASSADFSGALMTIASVTVDKTEAGNLGQANLVDSALWQIRLPGHGWMHAVVEAENFSGPKIPFNWGGFLAKGWWKGWLPSTAEFTPFRVGMCVGALFTLSGATAAARKRNADDKTRALVTGTASAMFPYDSWDLDAEEAGSDTTGRMRFERELAEIRAVIDSYGPAPVLLAFTSPEGSVRHNDVLSENRALATRQAVVDALGRYLAREGFVVSAQGEYPAKARGDLRIQGIPVAGGGLPDPEKYPSRDDFDRSPDGPTAKEWPRWRRVDVYVEGTLVARLLDSGSTP